MFMGTDLSVLGADPITDRPDEASFSKGDLITST